MSKKVKDRIKNLEIFFKKELKTKEISVCGGFLWKYSKDFSEKDLREILELDNLYERRFYTYLKKLIRIFESETGIIVEISSCLSENKYYFSFREIGKEEEYKEIYRKNLERTWTNWFKREGWKDYVEFFGKCKNKKDCLEKFKRGEIFDVKKRVENDMKDLEEFGRFLR